MPELDYLVPPSARPENVAILFVVSLIFFHAWMVFGWLRWLNLRPLKKFGFKVVDYVWIAAGGLALIGAMGQVRQLGAANILNAFDNLAPVVYDPIRLNVDEYLEGRGPSCRTFVYSEWSPPRDVFERLQREYNAACEWFRATSRLVPTDIPITEMDLRLVPKPPAVLDADLNRQINEFIANLDVHNKAAQYRVGLRKNTERSEVESLWLLLAPFLGSLALSLRLAKVTGELLLERTSTQTDAGTSAPKASNHPPGLTHANEGELGTEVAPGLEDPIDKKTPSVEI